MIKLFSLPNTWHIAKALGEVMPYRVKEYASGGFCIIVEKEISPLDEVLIIGNLDLPNLMEFISLLDAVIRAGAKKVALIVPYLGCARQDKMEMPYSSVGFEIVIRILNLFDSYRLITFDVHNPKILQAFSGRIINLSTSFIFKEEIDQYKKITPDALVLAPDLGSYRRIKNTYPDAAYLNKTRIGNDIEFSSQYSFQGKDVILLDDILDSGKTIRGALDFVYQAGANSIYAFVTHLAGNHIPKEVIATTDSLGKREGVQQVRIADLLKSLMAQTLAIA